MKKFILLSIVGIVVAAVAFEWAVSRGVAARAASSSSQIFIHGTPVCVFKEGEDIVARIGRCAPGLVPDEGIGEQAPFHGNPGMSLPPGHPPIPPNANPFTEPDMSEDGSHRVAI